MRRHFATVLLDMPSRSKYHLTAVKLLFQLSRVHLDCIASGYLAGLFDARMIPSGDNDGEEDSGGDAANYGSLSVDQGIITLAEEGNAEAQERLGRLHKRGLGVEKNQVSAADWTRKASDQGLALAQFNMGRMYERGTGVEKNLKQALELMQYAAVQNHSSAQVDVAVYYGNGWGLDAPDHRKAFEWCLRAADQGHPEAEYNLAHMYKEPRGTDKSLPLALLYCIRSFGHDFGDAAQHIPVLQNEIEELVSQGTRIQDWPDAKTPHQLSKLFEDGCGGAQPNLSRALFWAEVRASVLRANQDELAAPAVQQDNAAAERQLAASLVEEQLTDAQTEVDRLKSMQEVTTYA